MSAIGGGGDGTGRRIDRARIEAVFGEGLPQVTSDEREVDPHDERAGTTAARGDRDEWLLEEQPPHHG